MNVNLQTSFPVWKNFSFLKILLFSFIPFFVSSSVYAQDGLSKAAAEHIRHKVIEEWTNEKKTFYEQILNVPEDVAPVLTYGTDKMPFWFAEYGDAPFGERSLWISMHGGGGTTQEMNNGQWNNQKRLYRPSEGIYVAPRAPWNAWNMWFQEPIDHLFSQLIEMMIVCKGVNPNKVYLVGYSAGGDGVWRLAPRLAHRFAAASMMAGHPGAVSLLNVRNLPFMIWCGAKDAAYNRNTLCAAKGLVMDSLQNDYPNGYIHETHILDGKGHWMDGEDAAALPWMQKYTRNPYPKSIVWRQEEVLEENFYWIAAPRNELAEGMTVRAEVKGNTIKLSQCDYSCLTLYLNDDIVNLDKKVKVQINGRTVFNGKVQRKEDVMRKTIGSYGDPAYCFTAQLVVRK